MKGLLLVLIALALTGCDRLPTAANKARAAVKQLLNDPYSAKFEDVHDSPDGKTVCGFVNAKNAMSAYVGLTRFMFDKGKRQAGELVPLPYRGGVEKKLKVKTKPGSLLYLAMWRGLRGEGLDLETTQQYTLSCARHGVLVRFTPNVADLFEGPADD